MNNLFAAIMTKTTGSALSTSVGERIYLDRAPEAAAFPYVVFYVITGMPDDTFQDRIDEILVQFSILSTSRGAAEITGIYNNLTALFDNATLTITGKTHLRMVRRNLVTMVDDITTAAGTIGVKHWAVDYDILFKTP